MNTKIAESTFTPQEMDDIRAEVRRIIDAEGLSQAEAARQAGVASQTFHAWLADKYSGNNDRVAGQVQIWLGSREEQKRAASRVPKVPGFILTQSASHFLETLRYAQVMPEISVIAGGAGIGKTVSCRQYAATNPHVWLVMIDPSSAGVHGMLSEICEVMGITERSAGKLARAIGRKVEGTDGLIIVDEAQHLNTQALDQLRSIYDRYGIGVALVGNEQVYARLEGEGRKAQFAQLFSRIGVRTTQAKPRAKDMCVLIEAWGVSDKTMVRFLKAIAAKPGALRTMTKALQIATMIAAGAEQELNERHLKAAYERLTPSMVTD